jgi:hypothetical protein
VDCDHDQYVHTRTRQEDHLRDVAREAGVSIKITLTLLTTINAIGVGQTMWMYAGFNVLAFLFVLRYFPELAGAT